MAKFQDKRILIVDDDPDIVTAIRAALEDDGFEAKVESVGDGNTAVERVTEDAPDLLILDQMLPGRSGFLVMEKIRPLRKETGKPYVIMITANPGARHKVYAQTLGVDAYLNKPFRMDRLIRAANQLLETGQIEK